MKETKFRAWDKTHNAMSLPMEIYDIWQTHNPKMHLIPREEFNEDIVFIQYTGLKDKNSVEIYEGDIVKVICGCGYITNAPVCCKEGRNGYYLDYPYQHDWDNNQLEMNWHSHLEVIGNIYEHSYLLDKKAEK